MINKDIKDETLATHIKNGHIASSYLLIDSDILKLQGIAKWFSSHYNPADVFELNAIESDKSIKVKETEEFIAKAHLAAVGGKKLFIICDAATMTIAAQNKTLKTIEDTPANTCFLLLASSETPILNTIKSRCVHLYPKPINPSLTQTALMESNPNSKQIFDTVEKLLACKTLDNALPHLPLLTKKDNLPITLIAINHHARNLEIAKRHAIQNKLAQINRNIAAGCNPTNAFDMLLIELFTLQKNI